MLKERLDHPSTFSMESYITELLYEEMIKECTE